MTSSVPSCVGLQSYSKRTPPIRFNDILIDKVVSHICSFLSNREIAVLDTTSSTVHKILGEAGVWNDLAKKIPLSRGDFLGISPPGAAIISPSQNYFHHVLRHYLYPFFSSVSIERFKSPSYDLRQEVGIDKDYFYVEDYCQAGLFTGNMERRIRIWNKDTLRFLKSITIASQITVRKADYLWHISLSTQIFDDTLYTLGFNRCVYFAQGLNNRLKNFRDMPKIHQVFIRKCHFFYLFKNRTLLAYNPKTRLQTRFHVDSKSFFEEENGISYIAEREIITIEDSNLEQKRWETVKPTEGSILTFNQCGIVSLSRKKRQLIVYQPKKITRFTISARPKFLQLVQSTLYFQRENHLTILI